jgi:hypothetical protein
MLGRVRPLSVLARPWLGYTEVGRIGLRPRTAAQVSGRHIRRPCCRKRLTMTEPKTQRFRFRIQKLMVAIALLAFVISALRTTPLSIGGWEAAMVWRESYPLFMLFHMDELADSYPRLCNFPGSRWDTVYEVRPSAVVALTALAVGFSALTIRAGAKLRRMRRALMESDRPNERGQRGGSGSQVSE